MKRQRSAPAASPGAPSLAAFQRAVRRLREGYRLIGHHAGATDEQELARVAYNVSTHLRTLQTYLAGERPLAKHPRLACEVAGALLRLANRAEVSARQAERLREAARALGPDTYQQAFQTYDAGEGRRLVELARLSSRRWAAGFRFAPFRSERGAPMAAAIAHGGELVALTEIEIPPGVWRDPQGRAIDRAAVFMDPKWQRANIGAYLAAGVHLAPWHPLGVPEGITFLAIDDASRLVAMVDVLDPRDGLVVRAAQRDVMVALEIVQAQRASEGGREDRDDDDDDGEEWKRGTDYDRRVRR